MKALIVERPHPACILNLSDPARAYTPSTHTDVAETWKQHTIDDDSDGGIQWYQQQGQEEQQ